ncbi:serine/threonine-protein kinase [Yinghuangia soli]|uniref:serine/threonine-protein kinase n=1 Tax=Yinghuangia soli TaxID=2908204 RepID=UPI0027E27E84|nr:serine/threonine-protein kinase [Yinghuangia soli]
MRALERDDPQQIGSYRILRVLGSGGMGRVYLGRNPGGRTVAVKVIRPDLAHDEGFRSRFGREVAAARRVGSQWTAPVLDADTESDRPWLVTAYVAGPSLYQAVERHGTLPVSSVRALGAGLAEALLAIHGTGLIHRDLKPGNVLLSLDGPRVIDFGIARALDASVHSRTGSTIGSPGYMSPEQIDGRDIGPATDVFSLGSLLSFAASGETAFGSGNAQSLMYRIVAQEPRLDGVPLALRDLVAACLAKYPPNRPSPREILDALAPVGAAALVLDSWLPNDLTTDLSRRAVALLDIEDSDAEETSGSGLFAVPDLPSPHTETPSAQSGPLLSWRPPHAETPSMHSGPRPSWRPPPPPAPAFATSGGPIEAAPQSLPHDTPAAARGIGAVPLHRRRWFPVAAALTAVAVALGLFFALRDTDGDTSKNTADSAGSAGTGGTPTALPTPTDQASDDPGKAVPPATGAKSASSSTDKVPAGYVGTWTGTITSVGGKASDFTLTIAAAPNSKGVVATTAAFVPVANVTCTGDAYLVSASATEVVVQDIPGSRPQPSLLGMPLCTSGGRTKARLQSDGTLKVELTVSDSGNPTGTLTRK